MRRSAGAAGAAVRDLARRAREAAWAARRQEKRADRLARMLAREVDRLRQVRRALSRSTAALKASEEALASEREARGRLERDLGAASREARRSEERRLRIRALQTDARRARASLAAAKRARMRAEVEWNRARKGLEGRVEAAEARCAGLEAELQAREGSDAGRSQRTIDQLRAQIETARIEHAEGIRRLEAELARAVGDRERLQTRFEKQRREL